MTYRDRVAAGRRLAAAVVDRLGVEPPGRPLVLGLPRGGVPVAAEVATVLGGELDVLLVRKVGVPWQPELAMGAVAEGGIAVVDPAVLARAGVAPDDLAGLQRRALADLADRGTAWRAGRARIAPSGRDVVVVDDGMATGQTMLAACRCLAAGAARSVTVAVPVAAAQAVTLIRAEGVNVVCPLVPENFTAVGQWYHRFDQTTDAEVRSLLDQARSAGG